MNLWQCVSFPVCSTNCYISVTVVKWNPYFKGEGIARGPSPGSVTPLLVTAKLFLWAAHLASTWHAVNGLILQRNGGMSRTEIWRLKVFPLKCSNFGSSSSCPPWCLSSETTSYRRGKRNSNEASDFSCILSYGCGCSLSCVPGLNQQYHWHFFYISRSQPSSR